MIDGYVALWRKSIESEVFQNEGLWKLWTWCLMRANYKDNFIPVKTGRGETTVKVKRGQFIFGRNEAARSLNSNPSTVWKRMQKLSEIGNISISSNSHFSIVTVLNYEGYQDLKREKEQPSNNQVTTKEQPSNTDNKVKKVKKDPITVVKKRFSPPTLEEVSQYCIERQNNVDPSRWIDHYTSNGWLVGKNKMKDWKAAVRTWEKKSSRNMNNSNIDYGYM